MKLFKYLFTDGHEIECESLSGADYSDLQDKHGKCLFNGFRDQLESLTLLRANSHTTGDGFKPGFHPALGMEIRTNGQYQQVLRERGMVEVGNEKSTEHKKKQSSNFTDEIIKQAVDSGAQISGNEAVALIKGESLSASTAD